MGSDGRMDAEDPIDFRAAVRRGYDELDETYVDQFDGHAPLLPDLLATLSPGARVLNAGCGPAYRAMPALADRAEVMGLDLSRTQLGLATEQNPEVPFAQGDLTALPLASESVDALVEYHAVIHVPSAEHRRVYDEFARVLRPGGHAVVTLGTGEWHGRNPDWLESGAEMRWNIEDPATSRDHLEAAGFSVVEETSAEDAEGGSWNYLLVCRD